MRLRQNARPMYQNMKYLRLLGFQNEFQKVSGWSCDTVDVLRIHPWFFDYDYLFPKKRLRKLLQSVLSYINNMSIEETKIVFTDVQRLKTSRPLRVMIPKVLRNNSICPYSLWLDYIDRSTFCKKVFQIQHNCLFRWTNLLKEWYQAV